MNGMNQTDASITRQQKNVTMFPLVVFQLYLAIILTLYILGPWDWPTQNPFYFYSLLFLYQLAFGLGYLISIKRKTINRRCFNTNSIIVYLRIMIVLNLFYTIVNFMHTVGVSYLSLGSIIDNFINGLTNPSMQYQMKFNATKFGGYYFTYFSVITAPLFWPVIPLSIYYFSRLALFYKIIFLFSVLFEISRWLAIGTNKGIFDLIIIVIVVTMLKHMQKNYYLQREKTKLFKSFKLAIAISLLIIIVLSLFSNNVGDRINENWANYSTTNGNVSINDESFLMILCPDILKPTLIYLTSYLTQGYYAFSMSLGLDFKPLYGMGNSMFLMENFKEVFGIDLYYYTYQSRLIAYGWNPYVNWHSFYVWVANDVNFPGVIIIMFLIGYLLGLVYKDAIINSNPVALTLLCLICILMVYLPANNQVLSYPTTFISFWGLLFYWNFRKRYRLVW